MFEKPVSDQWKDRGVCSWCRRNGYCRKQCAANKEKVRRENERRANLTISMSHLDDLNRFIYGSMSKKPVEFKRKIIIHGAMVYGCRDCGKRWVMYLEKGLEDHSENHKPVPFGIICPFCGGVHGYDISGYLRLPDVDEAELPEGEAYFENVPDSDCGRPRYQVMPPREFGV